MPKDEAWLTAADCASRIGITIRALRVYEREGLIRPRRTGQGWRAYGTAELLRLHQILALKRLGLSLARIGALLGGAPANLDRTLALQEDSLTQLRVRLDHSLALIAAARAKIAGAASLSTAELVQLIRETEMTEPDADTIALRRYEQARPRQEVKLEPARLARYPGSYRSETGALITVSQREDRLFLQVTGQPMCELFPEGPDRFFLKVAPAQFTFAGPAEGPAAGLTAHQGGLDHPAERIDPAEATAVAEALGQRIQHRVPHPESEALIRAVIEGHRQGRPDYTRMTVPLAATAQLQEPMMLSLVAEAGALQRLSFRGVTPDGSDVFEAEGTQAKLEWRIMVGSDGCIGALWVRSAP
jgi:DNA-binding transcriptional MerR regulator